MRTCLSRALTLLIIAAWASPAGGEVLSGADVSSLPDIEHIGGVFRDHNQSEDELKILREHGCTIFRVRLFVNPDPSYKKTGGATQNIQHTRDLGRRIKAVGGRFLLDFH